MCVVAHNASFDQHMLITSLDEASEWLTQWKWFDSFKAFKELHKDLAKQYWPHEHPYSLETLQEHFNEESLEDLFRIHI